MRKGKFDSPTDPDYVEFVPMIEEWKGAKGGQHTPLDPLHGGDGKLSVCGKIRETLMKQWFYTKEWGISINIIVRAIHHRQPHISELNTFLLKCLNNQTIP